MLGSTVIILIEWQIQSNRKNSIFVKLIMASGMLEVNHVWWVCCWLADSLYYYTLLFYSPIILVSTYEILHNYYHSTKLYRKISHVCFRLYCYECAARIRMATATNKYTYISFKSQSISQSEDCCQSSGDCFPIFLFHCGFSL